MCPLVRRQKHQFAPRRFNQRSHLHPFMRPQVIEHHHAPRFETRQYLFDERHEDIAARATLNHEIRDHPIE